MTKLRQGNTLRGQFIFKIFLVFIIITLVLGAIQYYYLSNQINEEVSDQAYQSVKVPSKGLMKQT